jgi:hypothetical protein
MQTADQFASNQVAVYVVLTAGSGGSAIVRGEYHELHWL